MSDEKAATGRATRSTRITVACLDCDVTWRGSLTDECWSCGREGAAVRAPKLTVKVAATSQIAAANAAAS